MEYDAIVIGSGIGGSVAAAVLASEGLDVLVLEKNESLGGVCAAYEKEGFKVDLGTHMFSRGGRGPLGELARRVGATPIDFVQTRDLALVKWLGRQVVFPRDAHRLPAFILALIRELRLTPSEVGQATRLFGRVLTFDEARLGEIDRLTMWDYVTRYTQSPRVVSLFGFLLGLYFILPLRQISAGEGVWCFKRMMRDRSLSYPRGGAVVVPQTFLRAARARGAAVQTSRQVSRIVVDHGDVQGVECADGSSFEAPIVIGTTSLKEHVERLVGAEHFPDSYVRRVRSLRSSLVAVQAKLALRRPLVSAGALVGGHGRGIDFADLKLDDLERMYAEVAAGRIAPITPIYAPIPTNFDPTLSPAGTQLITACAVAPTTDIALQDEPHRWLENMMAALRALLPGLDRELLWCDLVSTARIGEWMGKPHAPAVSTGQTTDQVGNRRPPVHTPIRGLYVCGCGAGSRGVGTELAASSGAQAADRAVQDLFNGLIPGRPGPSGHAS